MQPWAIWQFSFALTVVIGIIYLVISELHIMERAQEKELWKEAREKIAKMG